MKIEISETTAKLLYDLIMKWLENPENKESLMKEVAEGKK
mgnify:CR=1 FL=1